MATTRGSYVRTTCKCWFCLGPELNLSRLFVEVEENAQRANSQIVFGLICFSVGGVLWHSWKPIHRKDQLMNNKKCSRVLYVAVGGGGEGCVHSLSLCLELVMNVTRCVHSRLNGALLDYNKIHVTLH